MSPVTLWQWCSSFWRAGTRWFYGLFRYSCFFCGARGKKNVNSTLQQAMKAQKGCRLISLIFLWPRLWLGVGGQRHASTALPPGNRPGIPNKRSWAVLNGCEIIRPHRNSISGPSSPLQVATPTTLSRPIFFCGVHAKIGNLKLGHKITKTLSVHTSFTVDYHKGKFYLASTRPQVT